MKPNRPSRREIASLCGEVGPEDGLHPDRWTPKSNDPSDRKRRQLAGQIDRVLYFLFAESSDEALHTIEILSVEVSVDGASARVTVDSPDPAMTETTLQRAGAWLRSGVAAAIHRRRTPTLRFTVLPRKEDRDG